MSGATSSAKRLADKELVIHGPASEEERAALVEALAIIITRAARAPRLQKISPWTRADRTA
ncbi:MAG: hypothetical protein H0V07_01985 [Propionibacteriales bacterium]|nr:hypothetical protein [Propionibacteriales bacterium]